MAQIFPIAGRAELEATTPEGVGTKAKGPPKMIPGSLSSSSFQTSTGGGGGGNDDVQITGIGGGGGAFSGGGLSAADYIDSLGLGDEVGIFLSARIPGKYMVEYMVE